MPNMYSDRSTSRSDAEVSESDKPKNDKGTALIPKSFFPGDKELEPGNECTVKVERVLDDQVEVSYSHSKAKESEDDDEMVEEIDEVETLMA